jgi:hypothetical protein
MATLTINREWLWDALTTMAQIGATPRGGLCRLALPAVLSRMCYSPSQRTSHLQPSVVLLEFMQVGTAVDAMVAAHPAPAIRSGGSLVIPRLCSNLPFWPMNQTSVPHSTCSPESMASWRTVGQCDMQYCVTLAQCLPHQVVPWVRAWRFSLLRIGKPRRFG